MQMNKPKPSVEFRLLGPEWTQPLANFFQALVDQGDDGQFHPHPFTASEAERLTAYQGKDLYYVCVQGMEVLAYGMLRGWDEGYAVPSLGIAVHPSMRGQGVGKAMMEFLHLAARRKGASRIRLKVYPGNTKAIKLYESLGYRFDGEERGQRVGYVSLCG
jgi:[ribosomal protein S18]-alanine N-acetyltransferase